MTTYAFVFARAGSKGLPNKNLRHFNNVPLVAHSINIARSIPSISKIFVSTDSDEIAECASMYSATVIKRPRELATDTASEWTAWQHAIKYLENKGHKFEIFVSLPPTSPLRNVDDIVQCIEALDNNSDIIITVTESHRNPYFNMIKRDRFGFSEVLINSDKIFRRQDAPEIYDITTVAYVSRPKYILNNSGIFDGRVKSVIIPKDRAIDIDDELDLIIAGAFDIYAKDRIKR